MALAARPTPSGKCLTEQMDVTKPSACQEPQALADRQGGDRQGCQALPTPEGSNGDLTAHRCPGEWAFSSLRGKSSQSSDFPKSEVSASQIGKTQGQTGRSKPCPASRGQSLLPRLSEMTHGHIVQQTEAPRRWRQRPLSATAPGPAEPV